jgi:hypothetical protein
MDDLPNSFLERTWIEVKMKEGGKTKPIGRSEFIDLGTCVNIDRKGIVENK